jgi:hypothetical protein
LRAQLQAALGTALQPSSAGVDDEDDEMDMEEGEGGSSSGVIVDTPFPFSSNGDMFVRSVNANGEETVQLFTANQKKEMEQYIQSLSRPPAASSSGAAGGSASASEQRDHLIEECKKLKAKYAALERKVKDCEDMDTMAVSACVCIHGAALPMTIVLPVQCKLAGQKEELTKVKKENRNLKKANEKYVVKVANLEKRLERAQAEAEYNKNEMKAKCGFDTREKAYEREIRDLKVERDGLAKALKAERELLQSNFIANTEQREELKQARKDREDFEAMKKEHISLKRSIADNTEVRDAKRKMEADRLRIQRAADEKVRHLEEELKAKQERIERLKRAARQREEEEEEDGDEDADGMDD